MNNKTNMVMLRLDDKSYRDLVKKANSFGTTPAAHAREIICGSLKNSKNMVSFNQLEEVVTALIPSIALAISVAVKLIHKGQATRGSVLS
ncbi:MAG: hypothetical protein EOM23_11885, partial [Candidatus Moranbacteria bacterium]|nr:hypothetical protein [Candidatus Moranbacteria bacterium]